MESRFHQQLLGGLGGVYFGGPVLNPPKDIFSRNILGPGGPHAVSNALG
jgi:hypothetical protein